MRRFTPRAASRAIDNCQFINLAEKPLTNPKNGLFWGLGNPLPRVPIWPHRFRCSHPAREGLRSSVSAFSAALLMRDA